MNGRNVLVIGGGVAGLTTANALARDNISVTLIDTEPFLGGHAIQYACKAAEACVKCGACLAEEKLKDAAENRQIKKWPSTRIISVSSSNGYSVTVESDPAYIDPDKCRRCNVCFDVCPQEGALVPTYSQYNSAPVGVDTNFCLNFSGKQCNVCQDACPEQAIDMNQKRSSHTIDADAVVIAAGFKPFDPSGKPYGYGRLENVITNLELERMLRQQHHVLRPSDRQPAQKIAFIQCVGSRDAKLKHLWCSKVCCASSLRMARLIQFRDPRVEIAWYYIDVQTFGKNFQSFYEDCQKTLEMVRIIPGDIIPAESSRLQISYFDNQAEKGVDALFDLVVLSIGMLPFEGAPDFSELFGLPRVSSGFFSQIEKHDTPAPEGIFPTGTTLGPMSIPETISSAMQTAWQVTDFLNKKSKSK